MKKTTMAATIRTKKTTKMMPRGDIPEFGAIFMSNLATMGECLEKQLFGLPSSNGDFVRRVRAGMLLFLFEYEKRELHGVFQATTDGAMNIVPHAYSSSGKQFPAQVRFSTVWECEPLSEAEFRDAIWENYYERNKFLFGLSQDQVCRLLELFNSKRMKGVGSKNLSCGIKRIWDYAGGDRGMETEGGPIFRRKLSSGVSVVSHRKLEGSPCEHTGNDEPHGSASSGVSGVGISSCELESGPPKVEEEPENSKESPKDSAADLGDFIPLPSPDNSDCEAEPLEPHLPLMLLSGSFPSDDCHLKGTQNSLPVISHNKSNASDDNRNHLPIKSLYSDVEEEKSSVFSRLNFGSKAIGREKGESCFVEKTSGYDSVQDIMGTLLQRHGSWRKSDAKDHSCRREDSPPTVKRSVFSRLSWVSESAEQKKAVTLWLPNDEGNERVRRARFSSQEREGYYKWSRTVKQFPDALEQNSCWKTARDREVSNQKLGDEENFEESSYTCKMLKRHVQTEDNVDDGSKCKDQFEQPPRRKLVRPMFKMPAEVKITTSERYVNQMTSEESRAYKENIGNCKAPMKGNTADEEIDTTVEKEMRPVLDPWPGKGGNKEAESNIIDEVSKSRELLVGGFNTHGGTTTTPLKVYNRRREKKVEVYSVCAV